MTSICGDLLHVSAFGDTRADLFKCCFMYQDNEVSYTYSPYSKSEESPSEISRYTGFIPVIEFSEIFLLSFGNL